MSFLRKNFLFFIVFITGAAVLIIQMTGIRILAPYFGTTLFTISSIVGIILGALSLGYYFGGVLADKCPKFSIFFFLIFIAGIFSLLIYAFSKTILPVIGYSLDIKVGPPIVSLILFFIPNLILGTMSPLAIKLKTLELKDVGKVSGKVFFWSTLGSITGSFLTGFFLVPHFGISKIIIYTSSLLIIIGFLGIYFFRKEGSKIYLRKSKLFFFLIIASFFSLITLFLPKPESIIFQKDGLYGQITIEEILIQDRKARALRFSRSHEGAVFLDSDELPFEYTRYYAIYKIINPQAEKALFLGGGAYSNPRKLLLGQNNIKRVDVAEIEPMLYQLARLYFRLQEDPRLFNHITDGRRFLAETNEKYDLIFTDVYYSIYAIPVHFTTQEFFSLAKSRLSENGIFLMNIIGKLEGRGSLLLLSGIKTFRTVFKNSYLFAVESPNKKEIQNFILLGLKNDSQKIDFESKEILESENEIIRNLSEKLVDFKNLNLDSALIFTDDFAPVEYLTAQLF